LGRFEVTAAVDDDAVNDAHCKTQMAFRFFACFAFLQF
jgi:hypothetical protein